MGGDMRGLDGDGMRYDWTASSERSSGEERFGV